MRSLKALPLPPKYKVFLFLFVASFFSASLGYVVLRAVMPNGLVFGWLYRMFLYHESHPFQYIALITAIYAVLGTVLIRLAPGLRGKNQFIAIVGLQFATVVVASIPGGMLWELHDMQAGYFPEGSRVWDKLAGGAWTGLQIGWLIIVLSIPYNVLGLAVGFWITRMGFRFNGEVDGEDVMRA